MYSLITRHPDGYPKELEFPYPRPAVTKREIEKRGLLLRRPADEDCFCLDHGPTPEILYMRYLRDKDNRLYNQHEHVRDVMTSRASKILDHNCPAVDAKMCTLQVIDLYKRGIHDTLYAPLEPMRECIIATPIKPLHVQLGNGHRDPETFPFVPKLRHIIDKNHPLIFTRTPGYQRHWFGKYIQGRSEYEDTYSRLGLARMRNARQYLEPQPSSRRRPGDPNC